MADRDDSDLAARRAAARRMALGLAVIAVAVMVAFMLMQHFAR